MNFELILQESFNVYGLSTKLSNSQNRNTKIIADHWQWLNNELKKKKISLGKNWKKYGLTYKYDEDYYYLSAIPYNREIQGFDSKKISGGTFVKFQHQGSMYLLKNTYYNIYKKVIPKMEVVVKKDRTLLHFEKYDKRFNWNNDDSIIDIFVPVTCLNN